MAEFDSFNLHIDASEKSDVAKVSLKSILLESLDLVASVQEQYYQGLVSEKLKAAADWDGRDSKQFKI